MAIRLNPNERVYQAGAMVVAEGEPASDLYIVKTGRVMVVKHDESGRAVVLEILGPGEMVGELALVDHQVRSASVQAAEITTCIVIPGATVRGQLAQADRLFATLLRVMALRLRLANAQLAELRRGGCATPSVDDPETARHLARHLRELETCTLALGKGRR